MKKNHHTRACAVAALAAVGTLAAPTRAADVAQHATAVGAHFEVDCARGGAPRAAERCRRDDVRALAEMAGMKARKLLHAHVAVGATGPNTVLGDYRARASFVDRLNVEPLNPSWQGSPVLIDLSIEVHARVARSMVDIDFSMFSPQSLSPPGHVFWARGRVPKGIKLMTTSTGLRIDATGLEDVKAVRGAIWYSMTVPMGQAFTQSFALTSQARDHGLADVWAQYEWVALHGTVPHRGRLVADSGLHYPTTPMVPEPSSWALLGLGLVGLAWWRRGDRAAAASLAARAPWLAGLALAPLAAMALPARAGDPAVGPSLSTDCTRDGAPVAAGSCSTGQVTALAQVRRPEARKMLRTRVTTKDVGAETGLGDYSATASFSDLLVVEPARPAWAGSPVSTLIAVGVHAKLKRGVIDIDVSISTVSPGGSVGSWYWTGGPLPPGATISKTATGFRLDGLELDKTTWVHGSFIAGSNIPMGTSYSQSLSMTTTTVDRGFSDGWLRLVGVELDGVEPRYGQLVAQSGLIYPGLSMVPEPDAYLLLVGGLGFLLRRWRCTRVHVARDGVNACGLPRAGAVTG